DEQESRCRDAPVRRGCAGRVPARGVRTAEAGRPGSRAAGPLTAGRPLLGGNRIFRAPLAGAPFRSDGADRPAPCQSGLKPDVLITGPHMSESAFWMAASSAPEVPVGRRPSAATRLLISGERMAETMAALSRATTSAGVLAGT